MANVIFNRSDNALAEPVEDGKLTFSTNGDGKMYLDKGNQRLEMGGARTIDSTPSTTSNNPIQNKAVTNNFPQNTDIVNTLSNVTSVTEDGIPCGTKPVRELKNDVDIRLANINLSVNREGKLVFTDSNGADTVIPFSNKGSLTVDLGVQGFEVNNKANAHVIAKINGVTLIDFEAETDLQTGHGGDFKSVQFTI